VCASRQHAGETLTVYPDTAERLAKELASGVRPRAVFVNPETDPFPPVNEVQRVTAAVVQTLADHGAEAWLMTRGLIRPAALEVLAAHRDQVKVTVAMTTLDRQLQRTLEPLTAAPHVRLRQIARLRQLGIAVQVALDPLIPGVTDTRASLSALLAELAAVGVRQVTAGYLFLRQGIAHNLTRDLTASGLGEVVLESFRGGPVLAAPGMAAARYLPKARRQRGYASLMALAVGHGIQVSVSALSNPDFAAPRRSAPAEERQPRLRVLFAQATLRREPA
jgi:DNA repair photolyase